MVRSAVLWLVVRITVGALSAAVGGSATVFSAGPAQLSLEVLAVVMVLAALDSRAMRERVLFANLGLHRWFGHGVAALTALVLESLLRLATGLA